jgi:hypothetical protein
MQINELAPATGYPCCFEPMEDAMSMGEAMVLVFIIAVFVTFGATLGWLSHH